MWGALRLEGHVEWGEDGRFANRPYEEGLWGRKWGWVPAFGDLCITIIPAPSQNPEVGI